MAVLCRLPGGGLGGHPGRGSQYASGRYQGLPARHGVVYGTSRRATCRDDALMGSSFASLGKELVHGAAFATGAEARAALFDDIGVLNIRLRRHPWSGSLSPADYERAG